MRLLILALFVPAILASQETIQAGNKVRTIPTPGTYERPTTGVVLFAAGDSAVVRLVRDPSAPTTLALSRLEVSRGQRTNGGRGALIGLLAGGVGGYIAGYAGGDDCNHGEWICFDRRATGAMGAVAFGAIGSVVGAIIGHSTKTDRWVRLAPRL